MQRRVDPSSDRFSRRTRGLPPEEISETISVPSQITTPSPSDHPQSVHQARSGFPPRPPSVHTVYSTDTSQFKTPSQTMSQVTLFPEDMVNRNYQQMLNNPTHHPNVLPHYVNHQIQPHHETGNIYTHQNSQHANPNSQMYPNNVHQNIGPPNSARYNTFPSGFTQMNNPGMVEFQPKLENHMRIQSDSPYHRNEDPISLTRQISQLTQTNIENQKLIAQLQTQMTTLITQNTALIQTVHQRERTQYQYSANTMSSLTESQLQANTTVSESASTVVPTVVQCNSVTHPDRTDYLSVSTPTIASQPTTQSMTSEHPIPTPDSNILSQLVTITKTTSENSKKITTFPKFSGKDFTAWYDSILSILSSPGWNKLYDQSTDDAIQIDPMNDLSADLYTSLKRCLQGTAQDTMLHKKGIRSQGINFLKVLQSTYNPKLSTVERDEKQRNFLSISRKPTESIDSYGARCIYLKELLQTNGIDTTPEELKTRFIMGLGPDFTTIKTALNEQNLPPRWQTLDIESLFRIASSFLTTIKSIQKQNAAYKEDQKKETKGQDEANKKEKEEKKPTPSQPKPVKTTPQTPGFVDNRHMEKDRARQARILADLQKGTFDRSKYQREVRPGACIYHGTIHKPPGPCIVLENIIEQHKNVARQVTSPLNLNPPVPRTQPAPIDPAAGGVARHTQAVSTMSNINVEDMHSAQDIASAADQLVNFELQLNEINEKVNSYSPLQIKCKHVTNTPYTRNESVKCTKSCVIDSGAFPHMWNDKNAFISYSPIPANTTINKNVVLADGTSTAEILGIGSIAIKINNQIQIIDTVLHVPTLNTPLLSVKQHCTKQGCYFYAANNFVTLAFPNQICNIKMKEEIYMEYSYPTKEEILAMNQNPPSTSTLSAFKSAKRVQCGTATTSKLQANIKRLKQNAQIPTRATEGSAGYDLYAYSDTSIPPGTRKKISTQISMSIPKGYYGRIAPRSGLSLLHGIDIAAGVIDSDYRGEIFPILVNNSQETFEIKRNSKIAQIIFTRTDHVTLEELDDLDLTKRMNGGFGSTDTNKSTMEDSDNTPKLLNQKPEKVTIKLPWSEEFQRATLKVQDPFNVNIIIDDKSTTFPKSQIIEWIKSRRLIGGHNHKISITRPLSEATTAQAIPRMRVVDVPPTACSPKITLNVDQLRKSFGFRNINSIINEVKQTSTNLIVSTQDREPIVDIGEVTTIDKPNRNTTPLLVPKQLGDIVHMDILFGAGTSIGGYKYSLFVVDRATRHKYLYPIRSLKTDILPAIKQLCTELGRAPTLIRTDFDHKIMGSDIRQYIQERHGNIESAPPHLQNQNGLCERNWRELLKMARNWLLSSLLPSKFWYHALKRATEISNYLPIKINDKLTTPHELVYKKKVDMRNLFPMFCVSYVDYKNQKSFATQTTKAITIGRSENSNILEFYHPSTKSIISSALYRFDESITAGPAFGLEYDGGFHFNKYCESNIHIRPPTYQPNANIFMHNNIDNTYDKVKVITIPTLGSDIYTIQYANGNIVQAQENQLSPHDPTQPIQPHTTPLQTTPSWIAHLNKCTLFLNTMEKPKHGILLNHENKWFFRPGSKDSNDPVLLDKFEENIPSLIETHQIFPGHPNFARIMQAKNNFTLSQAVSRHISAANLSSLDIPTLIQHNKLNANDKSIWDAAYKEEFSGLADLPAWETITQEQYDKMSKEYKTILPTMAISTIKYDEMGKPKRAKYRIVALGNLDKYAWTKSDCYAPVMNLLELRLLTALSIRLKRKLKSGDVKQAFVQALLPMNEQYVLRPPAGCPLSKPNTYWLLKRTLYGLKRSPKHWFDKAVKLLTSVGLTQCKNSPCIFTGTIVPGEPPLYLGLYVDDFVYFSESDKVEQAFEKKFGALTTVDFMGTVSHFLGIRFQYRQTQNELKVHLSQQAFSENLLQQAGLDNDSATTNATPYRSGYPVDKVKHISMPMHERKKLEAELRSYVGSLLWLSQGTRPDLATITNMLARYQNCPSPGHVAAAKYAIKYLKGTCEYGIQFTSGQNIDLLSFVNFPLQRQQLTGLCDANWGPQDQSIPKEGVQYDDIDLFKSRSISGHVIVLHGPLHWQSKRQKVTARSSAEAEIYATDQCVKDIIYLRNLLQDLQMHSALPDKVKVYNDNMACVSWSKSKTTKGLRYIQLRENSVRENKNIEVQHIAGKINPADMFSKEDKDATHFKQLRDQTVSQPFPHQHHTTNQTTGTIKSPQHGNDIKSTGENFIFREQESNKSTTSSKTQHQTSSHPNDESKTSHDIIPQQQLEHDNARQQHIPPPSKVGIIPKVPSTMQHQSQDNPNITNETQKAEIKHRTSTTQNHLSQQRPQKHVKFDLSKNEIKILEAGKTPSVLTVKDILNIQARISRKNPSILRHPRKETQVKFSQSSSNQQEQPEKPWSYAEMTTKNLST